MQGEGDRDQQLVLSEDQLKLLSNEFDVESIHTLDLSNKALSDISTISACIGLERLDLSGNLISRLHALSTLVSLTTLDLSSNRISAVNGIQSLDKLERLNLAGNLIGTVAGLSPLRSLEKLKHIRFKDEVKSLTNPICEIQVYKEEILKHLPRIVSLDGCYVSTTNAAVFSMLDALEADVASKYQNRTQQQVIPPNPVNEAMFQVEPYQMSKDVLSDARNVLEECSHANSRAEHLIAEAENKLSKVERV